MTALDIKIKHAGKAYDVTVDTSLPGSQFKRQIYELTGVPVDKVKVPVKGGMLKDDADMNKVGLKAGQTIMVIGAAGPLPPPPEKTVFMEDMTDLQLAQAVKFPVGLQNLGNTCYLNSTLQVLRSIPELQTSLNTFSGAPTASQPDAALTTSLRELYKDMSKTSEGFPPMLFLSMLRQWAPQFAERSRTSGGFAQQDAQEVWGSIVQAVKGNLDSGNFVDKWLTGEVEKTLKSAEAPEEPETVTKEKFLELKCNISSTTNYMITGITEGLEQDIEKTSPSLGRQAVYHESTKISRLPAYLTINLVRFYWRREINKKTKIMRRVAFPFDLDLMDLCTPDLKSAIRPVNEMLKTVDKDRRERAKIRRRAKVAKVAAEAEAKASGSGAMAVDGSEDPPEVEADAPTAAAAGPAEGELVDEEQKREEERGLLMSLVDSKVGADEGANETGMYELTGIVTHKGASADGGHYIAFSRVVDGQEEDPDKQQWYKFDDDKVTTVGREKITALEGGGEDHSAYILLYSSKKLA